MSKLTNRSKGSPYKAAPAIAAVIAKAAPIIMKYLGASTAAGGAAAAGGTAAAGGKIAAVGGTKAAAVGGTTGTTAGGTTAATGGKVSIGGMDFDPKKIMDLAQNFKKNKDNKKNSYSSINTDGSVETVKKNDPETPSIDISQAGSNAKDYGDIKLVTNTPYSMKDNSHRAAFQMSPYKQAKAGLRSLYDMYGSYDPASADDANLVTYNSTNNTNGNTTSQGTSVPTISTTNNNQTLVTNNNNTNNSNVQSNSSGGGGGGSNIPVQQGTYTTLPSGGSSSGGTISPSSSTNQGTGTTTSNIGTGGSASNINQRVKDATYNKPRVASKVDVTDMEHAGNPIVGKGELGTAIREWARMGKEKRQEVRAGDITNVSSKYLANQANPVGKGGRIQRALEGRQKRLNKRKARYMKRHDMGNMLTYDGGDVASDDIAGRSYIVKPGSDYIYGRSRGTSQPSGNNNIVTSNIGSNSTSAGAINAMATGTGPGPVNAPKVKKVNQKKIDRQEAKDKKRTDKKFEKVEKRIDKTQKKSLKKLDKSINKLQKQNAKGSKPMRPGKAERLERKGEKQKIKAAKKLIKERDADGKVTNYIENAARETGIALDATEGSTYNKLLGTRAANKNQADQRNLTVRQWKKGKEMSKRKMKKQIKASDPFIQMGPNPGGELNPNPHAYDTHLSDLKGKHKRKAKKIIRQSIKGRPGNFEQIVKENIGKATVVSAKQAEKLQKKDLKMQQKKKAQAQKSAQQAAAAQKFVAKRTAKSEKKLQRKFDKKRHASGGVDHGKVSYLKGPYKPNRSITLTLDKATGKLTRTKTKF